MLNPQADCAAAEDDARLCRGRSAALGVGFFRRVSRLALDCVAPFRPLQHQTLLLSSLPPESEHLPFFVSGCLPVFTFLVLPYTRQGGQ